MSSRERQTRGFARAMAQRCSMNVILVALYKIGPLARKRSSPVTDVKMVRELTRNDSCKWLRIGTAADVEKRK